MDGRDTSPFTRVFDTPCPVMMLWQRIIQSHCYSVSIITRPSSTTVL